MRSKFNEQTGLYEQVNDDINKPLTSADYTEQVETVKAEPLDGANTGKLHAFIVNPNNAKYISDIVNGKSKMLKSETPLKVLGKDGTIGAESMSNGKPVYLMIRVASKSERASSELQLELSDRIYLLFNTNPTELANLIENARGMDKRINVSAKGPDGIENTVSIWGESNVEQPDPVETTDVNNVRIDMDAQIENPGTSAGITGTVAAGINEQVTNDSKLALVKTYLGANAKDSKMSNGSPVVTLSITSKNTGIDGKVTFYNNGRLTIKDKSNKEIAKGSYSNGGKTITIDGSKSITSSNVYNNLKTVVSAFKKPAVQVNKGTQSVGTFKTQEEGDAFRAWANSTPELAAKYGKTSSFDLDATGKFNNSFINKAYAVAKAEYDLTKVTAEKEKNFKYKAGDIVYYRIKSNGKVKTFDTNTNTAEIDKQKKEMAADRTKTPVEDQYAKGANPHISEAIATSFDMYKQITENDDDIDDLTSDDVDSQAELIKEFKKGNIKEGKVIKQIDDKNIQIVNIKSNKEETINVSDIISKEDANEAELKIKANREAEEKAKKSDVSGASDNLKDARDEKKDAKKKFKDTKKTKRKNERTDKVKAKTEKINKKTDAVNTSESVVYSFDEFIKSVNKLN